MKNTTDVQIVCPTNRNQVVYYTMGVIDLVSGPAGKPVIVLFLIGIRCGREIKMFWSV